MTDTRTRALDDMMVAPGPGFPGGPFPPMHRVPVFSTMGRGPRGEKGDAGFIEFADPLEWDRNNSYKAGVIVLGPENVSYLSKQDVPAGVDITDTRYWGMTATPDAQVEAYREEVLEFDGRIESLEAFAEKYNDKLTTVGTTRVFGEVYAEFPFMFERGVQEAGEPYSMQAATMDDNYFYIFSVSYQDAGQQLYVLPKNGTWNSDESVHNYLTYRYTGLGHCNGVCCDDNYIYLGGNSEDPNQHKRVLHRINKSTFEVESDINIDTHGSSICMYGENDEFIADCENGTSINIIDKNTGETVKTIPLQAVRTLATTNSLGKQGMGYDRATKTFRICASTPERVLVYSESGQFISALDFGLDADSGLEIQNEMSVDGTHYLFLYQPGTGYLNYLCVIYGDVHTSNYKWGNVVTVATALDRPYKHELANLDFRLVRTFTGLNFFIQNSPYHYIIIRPPESAPYQQVQSWRYLPILRFAKDVNIFIDYPNADNLEDTPVYRLSDGCKNVRIYAPMINMVLPRHCHNMDIEARRIGAVPEAEASGENVLQLHQCNICSYENTAPSTALWQLIPKVKLYNSVFNAEMNLSIDTANSKLISQNCMA